MGSRGHFWLITTLLVAVFGCTPAASSRAPSAASGTPASNAAVIAPTAGRPSAAAPADQPEAQISLWAFGDAEELAVFQAVLDGYKAHAPRSAVKLNVV